MNARFCFIFVILFLTAVLIFTISIRSANNHIFYKLYANQIEQNRLKQQLANKQLILQSLINPAAISQQLTDN